MILKCGYYFVDISATKAPFFSKFETSVPKVVMDNYNNFRKDLCPNTRMRGLNLLMRDET